MVEIHHARELLQALDGGGARELPDGLHLARQRNDSLGVDIVPEEVEAGEAKLALLALVGVEYQAVLGEAIEQCTEVAEMLSPVAAGDEDVVKVDKDVGQVRADRVHQPLELTIRT